MPSHRSLRKMQGLYCARTVLTWHPSASSINPYQKIQKDHVKQLEYSSCYASKYWNIVVSGGFTWFQTAKALLLYYKPHIHYYKQYRASLILTLHPSAQHKPISKFKRT